jgi:lipopolysaccharide exporter
LSVAKKAVLGAIWSVSTSVGGRIVSLLGTLVLTRFLAPAEYGEVAVAVVIVGTINVITSPGFGQYIVAKPKAGPDVVFHATAFHIIVGWIVLVLLVANQGLVADLFNLPNLVLYLPLMAAAVAVDRIGYIPNRVLARDMRFNVLGLCSVVSEVSYAVVAVGLAWRGLGAAAVMWAFVVRTILKTLIAVIAVERKAWLSVTKLSMKTTRKMLDFGLPMTGASMLHWISHRGDNLLIAGLFGPAVVGQYNFAYNIADIPATHVGEHIGDVLLPSFANVESLEDKLRALIRASGLLALLVFPLAIGLGAVAYDLIAVILDPRWAMVAPMLLILSGLSVFRPVGWLVGSYLQAVLRSRTLMILETIKAVSVLSLIYLLSAWGVLWACVAIGIAFAINAFVSHWAICLADDVSMWALTKPYVRPFLACAPMVGAVLAVRGLLGPPSWWKLVLEIVLGGVAYVLSAFVLAGPQTRDFLNLLGNVLRRRRGAVPD